MYNSDIDKLDKLDAILESKMQEFNANKTSANMT